MLSLLIFLAVLSVLVLVHEFGHYVAARICGVKAEEFGYGFPPRAIGFVNVNGKWKRVGAKDRANYKNTIWSLNWLPLGGFVKLKGEEGEKGNDPDSFLAKGPWTRLFILAAGVMMNWLLAAFIFIVGFNVGIPAQLDNLPANAIVRDQKVQIVEVLVGSGAEKAGVLPADYLVSIDGQPMKDVASAQKFLVDEAKADKSVTMDVWRKDQTIHLAVQPSVIAALNHPGFGVALADTGVVRFPFLTSITQGVGVAVSYTQMIVLGFFDLIRNLVTSGHTGGGVSGPVGIAVLTSRVAAQGFWAVVQFTALFSLNLAIINFLPIPALDGGHALFVVIESFRRRRANPVWEAMVHRIGFITLLLLVLIITFFDLHQYAGVIWQGLRQAVGL